MALKYVIEFVNFREQLHRIEIDSPTYTGDPVELEPADQPLRMEWNGNQDDDPFRAHVINSTAQIQVFSENEQGVKWDIQELMSVNDASYKCRVYINSVLDWQGFILSDGIKEQDAGVAYPVTIKAIDGLELLDNVEFQLVDNYPAIIVNAQSSAPRCPMNMIRLALFAPANLDNRLPIRWSCSLRNSQFLTDDAFAGRTKINPDGKLTIYKKYSAFWYLKNICQSLGCWIVQRQGYWYIINYADMINLSGQLDFWEISSSTSSVQTAVKVPVNLSQDCNDFIGDNNSLWVKKPLGGVTVTYQNTTIEGDVLPNGNFDGTSLGQIVDWNFLPIAGDNPNMLLYESLFQRKGNAVQIANDGAASDEAQFSHYATIPLDTWKLFPSCTFGFTFMPQKGFQYNTSTEIINWSNNPLKISVSFQVSPSLTYYLNEFGFWQNEGRGLNLGTQFVRTDKTTYTSPFVYHSYNMYYEGTANVGDTLEVKIKSGIGSNTYNTYSFTVTSVEEGNLELALYGLMNALPNSIDGYNLTNKSVTMQSATLGYVRYAITNGFGDPVCSTYKSGNTQEFRYIYPFVEGLKINDVAAFPFSGKGGNSEILLPEIDNYNAEGTGRLMVRFFVKPGQQYVLDDVYFKVPQNNDVYTVNLSGSKNPKEEYTMEIGSSFSGHLLSSYGDGYTTRSLSMLWTGQKTLSQIYGESIMKWRNKPCRVFEGEIDQRVEWGYLGIRDVNYVPLSITYNAKDGISSITAIEARQDDGLILVVEHKSSSDPSLTATEAVRG